MTKTKKRLGLLACAAVLVLGTVGVTMAYFTDTDQATNTFTVGQVGIDLNESDVDNDNDTKKNKYHLIPGSEYVKDPTVSIDPKSEEAYIRMIVTVDGYEDLKKAFPEDKYYSGETFLLQLLCNGWDEDTWIFAGAEDGVYEFRYKETVANDTNDPVALDALFDSIVVPGEISKENLANLKTVKIHVNAHAIQAAGFKDADAAWKAFHQQTGL